MTEHAIPRRAALLLPLSAVLAPAAAVTAGPAGTLTVAGHNMTRGPVTGKVARAAVVIGQEIQRRRIRGGLPGRYRHWFPPEDPHQSISWDPRRFVVTRRGYVRFHRHGRAEGFPYGTPARGLVYVVGHLPGAPGLEIAVGGMWWLNSWHPATEPDRHTEHRRSVVQETTLPKVRSWLRAQRERGRVVVLEGDANSLRWPGRLPGLRQVKRRGLDRAWISVDPRIRLVGPVSHGPPTGVGRHRRHRSVHLRVEVG